MTTILWGAAAAERPRPQVNDIITGDAVPADRSPAWNRRRRAAAIVTRPREAKGGQPCCRRNCSPEIASMTSQIAGMTSEPRGRAVAVLDLSDYSAYKWSCAGEPRFTLTQQQSIYNTPSQGTLQTVGFRRWPRFEPTRVPTSTSHRREERHRCRRGLRVQSSPMTGAARLGHVSRLRAASSSRPSVFGSIERGKDLRCGAPRKHTFSTALTGTRRWSRRRRRR